MMNLYNYERITSGKASMSLIPAYLFDVKRNNGVWRGSRQIIQTVKPSAIYDIHGKASTKQLAQLEMFSLINLLDAAPSIMRLGYQYEQGYETWALMLKAYGCYYSKNPLAWLLKFKANQ